MRHVELTQQLDGSWYGILPQVTMEWCRKNAEIRNRENEIKGWTPRFVPAGMTSEDTHVVGIRGEVFVALAEGRTRLNCRLATERVDDGPDTGRWAVKTTGRRYGKLYVGTGQAHASGAKERDYLLVGSEGAEFWIRGWIPGAELIVPENLKRNCYGQAYVAPELALRPYEPVPE